MTASLSRLSGISGDEVRDGATIGMLAAELKAPLIEWTKPREREGRG
jgi:hypothetical protein